MTKAKWKLALRAIIAKTEAERLGSRPLLCAARTRGESTACFCKATATRDGHPVCSTHSKSKDLVVWA